MYKPYYKTAQNVPEKAPPPVQIENKNYTPLPKGNFLSALKAEDLLLLGLILFLLKEGTADKTLIFALVFIFLSGF